MSWRRRGHKQNSWKARRWRNRQSSPCRRAKFCLQLRRFRSEQTWKELGRENLVRCIVEDSAAAHEDVAAEPPYIAQRASRRRKISRAQLLLS